MAAVIILQKIKKGQAGGKQWGISKLSNLTTAILISKKPMGIFRQEYGDFSDF